MSDYNPTSPGSNQSGGGTDYPPPPPAQPMSCDPVQLAQQQLCATQDMNKKLDTLIAQNLQAQKVESTPPDLKTYPTTGELQWGEGSATTVLGQTVPFVPGNPQRVWLCLFAETIGGSVTVKPSVSIGAASPGITLSTDPSATTYNAGADGGLTTAEWTAFSLASGEIIHYWEQVRK